MILGGLILLVYIVMTCLCIRQAEFYRNTNKNWYFMAFMAVLYFSLAIWRFHKMFL